MFLGCNGAIMTDFISTMNHADRLAAYYKRGTYAAILLADWLIEHGFYGVRINGDVVAYRDNIRFDLGNS